MTSITFYFNADDRLAVACRLAAKALQQRKRVLVYAPEPELAQRVDRLLWTTPAVSFVPHCLAHDAAAAETPVLIAVDGTPPPVACDVLMNLGADCPPFFERHERLIEIVSQEADDVRAGRARFRFYRDRGYEIRNHDLAQAPS